MINNILLYNSGGGIGDSIQILPVIILSYLFFFLYTMYVQYSFFYKKTYLVALYTLLASVINIFLNYILIPKFGYQIAAWTTVISYFLLFIFHYINVFFLVDSNKRIKLKFFIPNLTYVIILILINQIIIKYIDIYIILFSLKLIIIFLGYMILFRKEQI